MSNLRKYLESAARKHRAARYPGELPADVFGAGTPLTRILLQTGIVAAAVAAVLLLAVWISRAPVQIEPSPPPLAEVDVDEQSQSIFALFVFPALGVPVLPEEFDLALEAPSLACSTPQFPQIDQMSPSLSTTQEPI